MGKTLENSQTENFFKNAQNVEIYQGNKSEVAKFFHLYKMAKTLMKILKQTFFKKILRTWRFIKGINLGLQSFFTCTNWPKYRVSQVKVDKTKQLFQTENMH